MVRRTLVALLAAVLGVCITASLGFWQLRRAESKLAVQAQWDGVLARKATALTPASLSDIESRVPLRVRARGQWLAGSTVWLDNRPLGGRAGFWMVTPLRLTGDGPVVLVFRGWAPRDPEDRLRLPRATELEGDVQVEGVAVSGLSNLLQLGTAEYAMPLPAVWQNLDYARFESASGLRVARFVIHQTDPAREGEGLARQPLRVASGVDRHYGYAVQWFSLAALIAGLAFFFGWPSRERAP